jgi:hypothetical protein
MTREEELEQDTKEYYEMIDRVAEVDKEAAIYLRTEAIKLKDFCL